MTTTHITGRQITMPHGTFYSLTTQAITNTAAVQPIALEVEGDIFALTHDTVTNNDRIYAVLSGSYELIFSGICDLASGAVNKHIEIYLDIEGTPVTDSNTRVQIPALTTEMTVAVAFIFDLNAGEYVRLMTWGDATTCEWLATAAATGPTRPAVPSVIVTMKMIQSYV